MDNLILKRTNTTPEVEMRFDRQYIGMRGEAYPENAVAYFGKLTDELNRYFALPDNRKVLVDMDLKYLNSASTKMLYKFFEALERAAVKGRPIEVQWCYESDDSMLEEFGEDLRDNFPNLDVQLAAYN